MLDKFIKNTLLLVSIGAFSYALYVVLGGDWARIYNSYFPCSRPIEYTMGSFDTRFGLNERDFLQIVDDAESVWEKEIGKELFKFVKDDDGALKVNLLYDYRQEATTKIKDLGVVVSDTRASYDQLKYKYDILYRSFISGKALYESTVSTFQAKQSDYAKKVETWNSKGGAPANVYKDLKDEEDSLNVEFSNIKKMESRLSAQSNEINSLIVTINRIADTLNLKVATLNEVGASRGEEFTEGEYKSSATGEEIDIYEFSTKDKLRRVLAHEFGHALGLDHVEDEKAIMYRLNQGKGLALSSGDIYAVRDYCHIE